MTKSFLSQKLDDLPPQVIPILSGTFTFYLTLATSTTLQQRLLRISTGSIRPLPTLIGVASVAAASLVSHYSATYMNERINHATKKKSIWRGLRRHDDEEALIRAISASRVSIGDQPGVLSTQTLKIMGIGLLAFKLFGGRFWGVAPSSFTHLGSFARASLPATGSYASANQRIQIERLGKIFGCHTCGSKMRAKPMLSVKFHGDHMPPKSVASQMNNVWWRKIVGSKVGFRFYPQCIDCSNTQGNLLGGAVLSAKNLYLPIASLAHAGGGSKAFNHGLVPRMYHLAGGVVGLMSLYPEKWQKEIVQQVLDEIMRFKHWVRGDV